jgi:iron complex outermembrane receptor protein
VINIILKTNSHGGTLQTTNGQTYAGDGFKNGESANIGLNLGDQGYLTWLRNMTARIIRSGPDR